MSRYVIDKEKLGENIELVKKKAKTDVMMLSFALKVLFFIKRIIPAC